MEEEEVCGICLEPLARCAHVGRLDGCTHRYCVACIAEWAKIANVCPQCKARFHAVREGSSSSGNSEVVLRVRYADNLHESRLQRASLRELTAGWTAVDHRELRRILASFGFVCRRGDYVAATTAHTPDDSDDDDDAALDADDPAFVVPDRPPKRRPHRKPRPRPRTPPQPPSPPVKHARRVIDSDSDTDTDTE